MFLTGQLRTPNKQTFLRKWKKRKHRKTIITLHNKWQKAKTILFSGGIRQTK